MDISVRDPWAWRAPWNALSDGGTLWGHQRVKGGTTDGETDLAGNVFRSNTVPRFTIQCRRLLHGVVCHDGLRFSGVGGGLLRWEGMCVGGMHVCTLSYRVDSELPWLRFEVPRSEHPRARLERSRKSQAQCRCHEVGTCACRRRWTRGSVEVGRRMSSW